MEKQGQFYDESGKRPAEIKRDIEVTRESMGSAIDELKERMSPHYIKERVKRAAIEKTIVLIGKSLAHAVRWGGKAQRNVKHHPAWYAAAGAGAGGLLWLLARGKHNGRRSKG